MKLLEVALVLAMIGVVLCLWLLVKVNWYNFVAFMLVAQPLLLLAVLMFAIAVLREINKGPRTPQS